MKKIKEETFDLEKVCLFIIKAGVYLSLLTPLLVGSHFFFPYVCPKSLYFMGMVEIISFAFLILVLYYPQYRPKKNLILISLSLFLISLFLSTIFGVNPSYSFWSKPERMTGLLMHIHLFFFFLAISCVMRKKDWIRIFYGTLIIGLVLCLINFTEKDQTMRHGATLGNSSFLGTYLLFNFFLAIWLFFDSKNYFLKIFTLFCASLFLYTEFSISARAAFLSSIGGLGLIALFYLAFGNQKKILNLLGRIGLILGLISFLIGSFYLFQSGSSLQNWFIKQASKARLVVWESGWKAFLERPILGWGPENFEFAFTKHFNACMPLPVCGGEIWFDRAHNIIFDTLVSSGIIGFLAYIFLLISAIFILWKGFFQKKIDFWIAAIFTSLLIAYSAQNLTVFDMVSSYLMLFLILAFISNVSAPSFGKSPQKVFSQNPFFIFPILIIFFFCLFKFILFPLQTSAYVISALQAPHIETPLSRTKLDYYKLALSTSPLGKFQIRRFFAQHTLASLSNQNLRNIPPNRLKEEIEFLEEELRKSIEECPIDFKSHLTLTQLYYLDATLFDPSKIEEAEKLAKRAIELSPTNQQGYWVLAQVFLLEKKFDKAVASLEKAISLEPRLLKSYIVAFRASQIMEDEKLGKKIIEEAKKINPQWKEVFENLKKEK